MYGEGKTSAVGRPPRDPAEEPTRIQRRRRGPAGPPPPWWRENPWVVLALLGVLVAAGVIVAFFALRGDHGSATTTITATPGTTTATGTTSATTQATTTTQTTTTTRIVSVPNVVGQTQLDAGPTMQDAGFVPNSYPVSSSQQAGTVVAQDPPGGTDLSQGRTVRLNVSAGRGTRPPVQVPDVTGPEASSARETLWQSKLTCTTLTRAAPSSQSVGTVLAQQPGPGTSLQQFAQVVIYVGT
jgi:PASTA domain